MDEEQEIDEVTERSEKDKRALHILLDRQKDKSNHVLAVKSFMGITHSFVTSVSLRWIAAHVRFARDLPNLKNKRDDVTRKIEIDEDTHDLIVQREPDWRRQYDLTQYLARSKKHKFPPILVAAWKKWVFDLKSDQWVRGRAYENSLTEHPLNTDGSYIDLDCTETEFYALDGQHRLMAIMGLRDLLSDEKLFKLNKFKKQLNSYITLNDLALRIGANPSVFKSEIQGVMDETMGIEIIPAVQKDETEDEARKRLRNIFVHVNRHAKKTTKGEVALLDEDDGFAVTARIVSVEHKLLKGRVDNEHGQLAETSRFYTTLETLVSISELWLSSVVPAWLPKGQGDVDLKEEDLELAKKNLTEYFDLLCELPSHNDIIQDKALSCAVFRKSNKDEDEDEDKENIFFRPIAQLALADAMSSLRDRDVDDEEVIPRAMKLLVLKEQKGEFRLKTRDSIWYGVLCDVVDEQMRRTEKYKKLCARLLLHLLGKGTDKAKRMELEEDFREARKVDDGRYINIDGNIVKSAEDVKFPDPW